MENKKPFSTIDEQVALLESRGMLMNGDPRTVLMREGYYSVVNGYKDIFIDGVASAASGDDRFVLGTTFEHVRILFDVDRALRECTFHALVRAETTMRNAVVYAFCDRYREPDAYLDATSYCGKRNYRVPERYDKDLIKLLATLRSAHNDEWHRECVAHYLGEYGYVPLWVLANTLTFGNMSYFYDLQGRSVQNEACKIIAGEQGVERISPNRLSSVFSTLVDYRNVCAHDDRLYCARTGKRHDRFFSDMMNALSVVADENTMRVFVGTVTDIVKLFDPIPTVQERVMSAMRVEIVDGVVSPLGGSR